MFYKLQNFWKALNDNFKLLATTFIICQTIDQDCLQENTEIFLIMFGFGTSSTNEKQINDVDSPKEKEIRKNLVDNLKMF